MRIAITIEELDTRRGGAEVATLRLIGQLAQRGHEVHVLTRRLAVTLPPGAQAHLVGGDSRFVALREWRFPHRVARQLAEGQYDLSIACGRGFAEDVVWAHNGAHAAATAGQLRCYGFNPLYRLARLAQYYYSPKAWVHRRLEALRFARQPVVITGSQMCARDFRSHYGVGETKLHVVYYQINLDRFSPAKMAAMRAAARAAFQLAPDELTILCVARNYKRKGIRTLVEAAARLCERGRHFRVLVADSTAREAEPYVRQAQRLGCADNIRFLRPVERIEEVYAAVDVFCLPTFYDPCALVIVEAMACGLPTITSRFNGASELIRDGEDGFVLQDPGNAGELADVLDRLFDAQLRHKVGTAAVATARGFVESPVSDIVRVVEQLASASA
jgi:UDP-glucose:(heptosyl)LPS alpha-1,3-glucosyltransferase